MWFLHQAAKIQIGLQVLKGRQLDLELHNPKVMVTDVNIQGVSKKALSDLLAIN